MRIRDITHLLSDVGPGTAFVVIKGRSFDNSGDVAEAVKRGATLLITPEPLPFDVEQILAEDPRREATRLADKVYPEWKSLKVVGITGTNGKTTTSFLIREALKRLGYPPALIGTIVWDDLHAETPSLLTTPEPFYIRRIMGRAARKGARFAVMEVSSIGLDQGRVDGIGFEVGVLTNLSRDHLDYHGEFENYRRAKSKLFKVSKNSLLNADDDSFAYFSAHVSGRLFTYGTSGDFRFEILGVSPSGLEIAVNGFRIKTELFAHFNAYNLTAAFGSLVLLGFPEEDVALSLQGAKPPRGRLERVYSGDFHVFVDYAHTPDAMEKVLSALKGVFPRVVAVFGAGGDRDRGKRPLMARAAERYADTVVITSDNPRWEDPERILDEIEAGFERVKPVRITDRREAIRYALRVATEGTAVVILGKGHEGYQEVRGVRQPFDDREEVLKALGGGKLSSRSGV